MKLAWPLASVVLFVPCPAFGPLMMLKATEAPAAGLPLVVTVARRVSARLTMFVMSAGTSEQSTTMGGQNVGVDVTRPREFVSSWSMMLSSGFAVGQQLDKACMLPDELINSTSRAPGLEKKFCPGDWATSPPRSMPSYDMENSRTPLLWQLMMSLYSILMTLLW